MKLRPFAWMILLLGLGVPAHGQTAPARYVLLVASRSGSVEAVDPATLASIGTIHVGAMVDWVSPLPDGATLLVALSNPPESQHCCAIYSLDLQTAKMRRLIFPAMRGVISPDGHTLFAQRGNVCIDVVDLLTLAQRPSIGPPGKTYFLQPSSDRRWLFGVTYFYGPSPSLDIFDLKTNTLDRSLAVPGNSKPTGAWSRDTFYLLGYQKGRGTLWSVTPETRELAGGKPVDLRALSGDCRLPQGRAREPHMLEPIFFAGGRLFVYEGFGMKTSRPACAEPPSGGVYVLEPSTGAVVAHLAPSLYFLRVIANSDGTELYGIELGRAGDGNPVRLIRFDARTGKILAERELGKWGFVHVSLAYLFDSVIPRGEIRAVESTAPAAPACSWTKPVLDEPAKVPGADRFGFGEWYVNENRTIWTARQDWRAGEGLKVIWLRPPGAQLEITGRRLDAPSPPLRADFSPAGAYPSGFEVTGMTFPAAGCWEVTAKAGSEVLTFVTPVREPRLTTAAARNQR